MTAVRPFYASVDELAEASDFSPSMVKAARLERHLASASRKVDDTMRRHFYPWTRTLTFRPAGYDTPAGMSTSGFYLDEDLTALTAVTVDGVAQTLADVDLWPLDGPPYAWIGLTGTEVIVTGVFGFEYSSIDVATLSAGIDDSTDTVAVSNGEEISVGDLLTVDTERFLVTARTPVDSGQNLAADLVAKASDDGVGVTDGSAYTAGETMWLGSERMRIVAIAGNTLIVARAWLGSTLAAHTAGTDIYVERSLTVTRQATGTAAAAHSSGATVSKSTPPETIKELALAEAQVTFEQEASRYARTVGSGEGEMEARGAGIADVRKVARRLYRRPRVGAV